MFTSDADAVSVVSAMVDEHNKSLSAACLKLAPVEMKGTCVVLKMKHT
jgi:hypothetical protein